MRDDELKLGRLGRGPGHDTRTRDRLINQHHVLQPVERGVMQFSVPGFADWVVGHVERSLGGCRTAGD